MEVLMWGGPKKGDPVDKEKGGGGGGFVEGQTNRHP